MRDSQPQTNDPHPQGFNSMQWGLLSCFVLAALLLSPLADAQNAASSSTASATCPIQFINFSPSNATARIRNTSGKKIVGLVFNIALADAAEHWKWLHYDFDDARPIREFGWNKEIKDNDAKTLSWYPADVDFYHGGGGALVLTSVLFEDGSSWEESKNCDSCKFVWYNGHKKTLVRPVDLPYRQ
jgi:hypothetical protein